MSRRSPRSKLPARRLRRESDGSLFDVDERRRLELAELCDDVRAGRYFRAVRHSSGEDCTHEVLSEVLAVGLPRAILPGSGGGGFESMVSSLFKGLLRTGGSARSHVEDQDREHPKDRGRERRRTGKHDWWEGGPE